MKRPWIDVAVAFYCVSADPEFEYRLLQTSIQAWDNCSCSLDDGCNVCEECGGLDDTCIRCVQ